jgi:hypothetical protein
MCYTRYVVKPPRYSASKKKKITVIQDFALVREMGGKKRRKRRTLIT